MGADQATIQRIVRKRNQNHLNIMCRRHANQTFHVSGEYGNEFRFRLCKWLCDKLLFQE
jgi:ribosomal protein L37E